MNEFAATRVSPAPAAVAERVSAFLRAVYGWMCVGLGVTAVVASAIAASPAVTQAIASNHLLFLGALFAELALVFYLSARVQSLTSNAATLLFLLYSGLNGVTLSVLLLAYTGASIATTFVVTAGMFGALAAFGSATTRSLAGAGQFFVTGLTAWDAQRLKHMAAELPEGRRGAYAIVGALSLYLNFINLFLILLRFTGGRRS